MLKSHQTSILLLPDPCFTSTCLEWGKYNTYVIDCMWPKCHIIINEFVNVCIDRVCIDWVWGVVFLLL